MPVHLRASLDAAPDAMLVIDEHGRIEHANAQAETLFGYAAAELVSSLAEAVIPERAHGRKKDGTEFPAEVSLGPMKVGGRALLIATIHVGTARQRGQEAEHAIRMRDEFLSIASHELKTPLTALQLQIESLLRRPDSPPNPAKLRIIHRSLERLGALINQLLDVSRVTSRRLELEKENVDLGNLIRGVAVQFDDELARAKCDLRLDLPAAIHVSCDPLRIEQVITNLITNALKYGSGNAIELGLAVTATHAEVRVRDHGIGIAAEDQGRIFERFERVDSERSHGGFGLGLWIVRQILESHGGTIRVSSERGVGSVFTASLPLEGAAP